MLPDDHKELKAAKTESEWQTHLDPRLCATLIYDAQGPADPEPRALDHVMSELE